MERISLDRLALKMIVTPELIHLEVERGIKKAAMHVRDTATKKFGEYQPAVGEFPEWEKLAESTVAAKAKAGGNEDPLIGHYNGNSKNSVWPTPLRNTIGVKVEGMTAAVGTDDPIGKYHEHGASGAGKGHNITIPPRPFLRPALYESMDIIKSEVRSAIARGLLKM